MLTCDNIFPHTHIHTQIDLNSPRSKNVPLLVYMQNVAARTTQLTSTTPSLKVAQISKLITELSETYVCDLFRAAAATNKDQIREGCGTIKKKIDEILGIVLPPPPPPQQKKKPPPLHNKKKKINIV